MATHFIRSIVMIDTWSHRQTSTSHSLCSCFCRCLCLCVCLYVAMSIFLPPFLYVSVLLCVCIPVPRPFFISLSLLISLSPIIRPISLPHSFSLLLFISSTLSHSYYSLSFVIIGDFSVSSLTVSHSIGLCLPLSSLPSSLVLLNHPAHQVISLPVCHNS